MELEIFRNPEFGQIRVVSKEGEPWFVAIDVCTALGHSNATMALERLDDDERSKFSLGRQGETNIVNEPGLYSLVLGSRKPEAKAFKRWITHEVIPAIRKTGAYSLPKASPKPAAIGQSPYGEAVLLNARTRQATLIVRLAENDRLGTAITEALTLEAAQVLLGRPVQMQTAQPPVPALPEPPKVPVAYPPYPTPAPKPAPRPAREQPKEPGERYYTASEIAGAAGKCAPHVGTLAKKHGLKTPEYGVTRRIYDRYSGGEVDGFFYNERGRAKLLELLTK